MQDIIFISSPYTHASKAVEAERERRVRDFTAYLLRSGIQAFSPIVYGHAIATAHDLPTDWKFWQDFCLTYLERSAAMYVLMLEGWDVSTGVTAEITACVELLGIPVHYVDEHTYEIVEARQPSELKL